MTYEGYKFAKWAWREAEDGTPVYGCKHDKYNSKYFNASEWIQTSSVNSNSVYMVTVNASSQALTGQMIWPAATLAQTVTVTNPWYDNLGGMNWYFNQQTGATLGSQLNYNVPPETPEQRAARHQRYEERLAKELAERKAAECRAENLLFTILTPSQVKQYKDDGFFEQAVNERIYRIKKGRSRNIEVIEAGKRTALLCAHPTDAYELPIPDVMLSQLLSLQANEAEFLKIANRTVVM